MGRGALRSGPLLWQRLFAGRWISGLRCWSSWSVNSELMQGLAAVVCGVACVSMLSGHVCASCSATGGRGWGVLRSGPWLWQRLFAGRWISGSRCWSSWSVNSELILGSVAVACGVACVIMLSGHVCATVQRLGGRGRDAPRSGPLTVRTRTAHRARDRIATAGRWHTGGGRRPAA